MRQHIFLYYRVKWRRVMLKEVEEDLGKPLEKSLERT